MRLSPLYTVKLLLVFLILSFAFLITAIYTVVFAQPKEGSDVIPNKYIVVLKDNQDAGSVTDDIIKSKALEAENKYNHAIKGFSATIPAEKLAAVKNDPRVEFVSEDHLVQTASHLTTQAVQTTPSGIRRIGADVSANEGSGAAVAVIDTGIDLDHPDLKDNVLANKNCVRPTRSGDDDNGHGSHVAGTIAGVNNTQGVLGVASSAKLIAVKVLNSAGSGTWSQVICGIDWVTANASTYNIKVANMSLGGGGSSDNNCGNSNSDALHKAICKARDAGVTFVVAAGNSGANSSGFVPAAYDDAVITVSALADSDGSAGGLGSSTGYGADDTFASFSNYGSAVDLGAPGVNIYSTWKSGGYNTISGTSMATPHVTGAAAMYIAAHPGSSWDQVRDGLKALAEPLGSGHTDPSGKHPEPVLKVSNL